MAVQKNKIAFTRMLWCESAAAKLLPLVDAGIKAQFVDRVFSGDICLWRVRGAGVDCWLCTSLEKRESGIELVLEVIAGKGSKAAIKQLLSNAKKIGIRSARFETFHSDQVVKKLLSGTGFNRFATIHKVAL